MATRRDLMEVMVRTVGLILVVFFALQFLLLLVALAEMLFHSRASGTPWTTMGWTFPIYLGILLLLPVPFFLLAKRISCWIIREDREIWMHELLYPVLQGWDSVALESDLTIVGTDQLFNEMMGRFFQERNGQDPQIVMTTKITAGLCGRKKQSKSLGTMLIMSNETTFTNQDGKVVAKQRGQAIFY